MGYVEEIRQLVGHKPLILNGSKVIITDESGRILLQKCTNGIWDLPGGLMELGESLEDTARREVFEETNLIVGQLTLFGIFSGSEYFVKLANGDQFYAVTTVFSSRDFKGNLQSDGVEGIDVAFFERQSLPNEINPRMRDIIKKFIDALTS